MPFVHGRSTKVLLDGRDISVWLRSAEFNGENDPADTTTFSKSWKTAIPGANSSTFEADGLHDVDMQDIRAALLAGANSVLTWGPGGLTTVGEPARLMASLSSQYAESSPVGGAVAFKWRAESSDDMGAGVVLHALAAETTTGTSTPGVDGGAATTLGAVANLHVTARSGTSPTLVVKFSDSTTLGGTYTDIASGSFVSMNAVGGQRLVIPGTVRQFVKATWTIAGGSPSFTFAVALARR